MIERNDNMEFFAGKYKNKSSICQVGFSLTPLTNFLIMFPSWIHHSVEMNMEDRDRISIAFNFVESGQPTPQYG